MALRRFAALRGGGGGGTLGPMRQILHTAPPEGSLIAPFAAREGHYVDAFCVHVPTRQYLRDFVAAFYTTRLFRVERMVLGVLARSPSSDADAMALAAGVTDRFAVWSVEARRAEEVLLADASGRTKSWLHAAPEGQGTRLWFGSVVVPVPRGGSSVLGPVFHTLEGAHRVYARLLLQSAAANLGG